MSYQSTKTFGHELGLSAAFRQWRATHSHCSKLHGYALSFKFVFEADALDERNWVMDFGGLKSVKESLQYFFDHKTAVASDDPALELFEMLDKQGVIDLVVLESVGCEAFATLAYGIAARFVSTATDGRVRVVSCECREHGANSAIYINDGKSNGK